MTRITRIKIRQGPKRPTGDSGPIPSLPFYPCHPWLIFFCSCFEVRPPRGVRHLRQIALTGPVPCQCECPASLADDGAIHETARPEVDEPGSTTAVAGTSDPPGPGSFWPDA